VSTPRVLADRYELREIVGIGGMSEVHLARDLRLNRDVAVKVLHADLARDPSLNARFRREAQKTAGLNHAAIVAVYDSGEVETSTGQLLYIVMEYVEGLTLRDTVRARGAMTPRRAIGVAADVCEALEFSHRHGIVHRDVKPANILISEAGAVNKPVVAMSTPAPTSTHSGVCCTNWPPAKRLSLVICPSRSPTSTSARTRICRPAATVD
jgi:serine/threonine protein kinase